jgi:hypothetical protein
LEDGSTEVAMLAPWIGGRRARAGRGPAWTRDRQLGERAEQAWNWLRHDERGRVIGLVLASVALSIAMSIVATAVARVVERRCASASAGGAEPTAEATTARDRDEPTDDAPAGSAAASPDA